MTPIDSIILGIIEGLTEFLPVSSTGHLILGSELLGLERTDFLTSFEIFIQLGAICAVIALYAKKILSSWSLIKKIVTAFIPTAVLGFALYGAAKQYLLGSAAVTVWALGVGGVVLILFELWYEKRRRALPVAEEIDREEAEIGYGQAFWVGVFQALAIIPGVSRSGASIIGGLALGISREKIVEFSFLLAIPTIAGAAGLDLIKSDLAFSGNEIFLLAIGFVVSFVVAILAIRFFLSFVRKHSFVPFGVYRIALALVFLAFFL